MDLPASESEPLLQANDDPAHGSHTDPSQVVVGTYIKGLRRRRVVTDAAEWTVQQLTSTNVLLIFVPLGLGAGILKANAVPVSVFNFLAIIPLSVLLSDSSDKLSDILGPLIGQLINATFGNAVELTVGILAILYDESYIAQSVILGSILSDILAVLGVCLIVAAHKGSILKFNSAVTESLSSLMIITSMALVLPSVLFATLKQTNELGGKIRFLSQVTAVALLVIYVIFLYFQLGSHKEIFLGEENDLNVGHDESENRRQDHEVSEQDSEQEDRPETHPQALWMAVIILVISALAIMACSFYFINNLDATAESIHVSQTFIAMIIIPISSNAPEASALIMASQKKRINYAIGVIVGSILQVALFVLPILVIIGSTIHKPMTLYFETSQTSILFLAVLMVNHLLQDGMYTYLHGIMLLSLYTVTAAALFIQPVG